jgi:DUF1680 family protein
VKKLRFFIPSWVDGDSVKVIVNGEEGLYVPDNSFLTLDRVLSRNDVILIQFDIKFRSVKTMNHNKMPGYYKFMYGPVVLGVNVNHEIFMCESDEFNPLGMGRFADLSNGEILEPVNDMTQLCEEDAKMFCRQILFMNSPKVIIC